MRYCVSASWPSHTAWKVSLFPVGDVKAIFTPPFVVSAVNAKPPPVHVPRVAVAGVPRATAVEAAFASRVISITGMVVALSVPAVVVSRATHRQDIAYDWVFEMFAMFVVDGVPWDAASLCDEQLAHVALRTKWDACASPVADMLPPANSWV